MAKINAAGVYQQYDPSGAWQADFLNREHLVPAGGFLEPSQFLADNGTLVIVDTGGAAADATSVPVKALTAAIPNGTALYFGGSKKLALLTAAAAAGDTALTVQALPTALVAGNTATYTGDGTGVKRVISGTLIGRTFTERDAGTGFGPADVASDEEIYLLAKDVPDLDDDAECELYRHGSLVKENLLPNWANYTSQQKTWLRANYQCIGGLE